MKTWDVPLVLEIREDNSHFNLANVKFESRTLSGNICIFANTADEAYAHVNKMFQSGLCHTDPSIEWDYEELRHEGHRIVGWQTLSFYIGEEDVVGEHKGEQDETRFYSVHMLAYQENYCVRNVEVPVSRCKDTDSILEAVYELGQNCFQAVPGICSVSAGDVIEKGDKYYLIVACGFEALTKDEFISYCAMPQDDRLRLMWKEDFRRTLSNVSVRTAEKA